MLHLYVIECACLCTHISYILYISIRMKVPVVYDVF